ncbi:TetR/AcrR family transcriptional regulator [Marivivens aquimaris]|uniref:TetR/AcrR family transcriptional regulator n=1 Tax=Marivivens aquimaris TaxID=2774876 RepID=UPI001880E94D|nr:TetR/AcrR family transcriptional regulator [Marivivens aquimaris]
MPYSAEHKRKTRAKIIETARILFNKYGFQMVTIDMVMSDAGLTRGGFYNHFKNKEELFSEAVQSFLMGRGAKWRDDAGIDLSDLKPEMAQHMIDAYLSRKHLGDLDGQCPMIALPSDVARADTATQESFQRLLEAMVWLFETNMQPSSGDDRRDAQALAALCVGGMVLAKALPDSDLAESVRQSTYLTATALFQKRSLATASNTLADNCS